MLESIMYYRMHIRRLRVHVPLPLIATYQS
jgi:hypothetical protein